MSRLLSSLTLISAIAASPALAGGPTAAADEGVIDPPLATVLQLDWSGLYAGLSMGSPRGHNFWSDSLPEPSSRADWTGNLTYLTFGYDRQSGNLVYGGAVDIGFGSLSASGSDGPDFGCGATGCNTEINSYKSLRGRVGVTSGKAMLYGTAGLARADVTVSRSDMGTVGPAEASGWVAGVGVEVMLSNRLSLDVSYLHNELGRIDIPAPCTNSCFTDVSFGLAKVGLNLHW